MKIVKLAIENVKRIAAVEITPQGALVAIGGDNAQGKSSVLDAIMYALAGKGAVCERPLRDGADHGRVEVDCGDLRVVRTFTPSGGGSVTVYDPQGRRYGTPQAVLDALLPRVAFDPLEFARAKSAEQVALLQQVTGLDCADLDARAEQLRAARKGVNDEVKALGVRLQDLQLPGEEIDRAAVQERLNMAHYQIRAYDEWRGQEKAKANAVHNRQQLLDRAKEQLERQQAVLAAAQRDVALASKGVAQAADAVEVARAEVVALRGSAPPAPPGAEEVQRLQGALAAADRMAGIVKKRQELQGQLEQTRTRSTALTAQVEAVAQEREQRVAAATMPLPGLALEPAGVTYQGVPLSQCSGAELLRISVAIGLALHPELMVLLVREGSALDATSLAQLAKLAEAAGAQVWLERVGHGSECQVIIHDGRVVEEVEEVPMSPEEEANLQRQIEDEDVEACLAEPID